ncbi:MAG: PAS domain S-box protein [Desulfobacterales bacterium]|nr:PAS domain S-box protein [Desulfobacterales bacterium]
MATKQTLEEVPRKSDDTRISKNVPRRGLTGSLAITAIVMLIGVSLSEWLTEVITPNLGGWKSHVVTIIFSSLLATAVAWFFLKRQDVLLREIDNETATHEKYEEGLRESHVVLERAVDERATETAALKKELEEERKGRENAEGQAKKIKETYRAIIDSLEDGYYEVDVAGNFTFFNDAIPRLLGYSREEVIGMNDRQYTNAKNSKKLFEAFNKVYTTGEPVKGFGWEVTKKDGTKSYVEASVSLVKEPVSGKPTGFRGIVRDITERKRAGEALKRSEEKYRTILESIEDGYYEVDVAGNFTFFNDSLVRIFGYPREELMGMNNRQYANGENARKVYEVSNKVYATGEPAKGFDWEIIRKDGTKRCVEGSVSPIKDPKGGPPIGFRGIVRDVTERKETEKKIKQLLGSFGKMMT